jgi:hypothetical protein
VNTLGQVDVVEDITHSNELAEFVDAGPLALAEVDTPISPAVAKVVAEESLKERLKGTSNAAFKGHDTYRDTDLDTPLSTAVIEFALFAVAKAF